MSSPASALQATSTFYAASPGLRWLRLALAATQRLWPALAVRVALRIFGTPLPPRWLQRRSGWDRGWQHERWPFEDGTLTLYTRPGAAAGPLVLLVHGWGGEAGQMLPLADALAAAGLQPVLLDLPAHGRSAGTRSNLPQFARAIGYATARLRAQGQALHALVAHSLGANAAALATSRDGIARHLVLLAPPASPRDYTGLFAHVFGLSEATRAALQARIEAREGALMADFEPPAVGPRIGAPSLVVHDRGDRINPFAHGEAFAAHIAGARLLATSGLGHRKVLHDAAVLQAVAAFLAPDAASAGPGASAARAPD
ncbi:MULTISPECIES: alpha/beta fold hydrolase [Ramlibacter]|uniref:Alpha/beta fold hydrolase n=1 Tax=Ramlibacter pinisoli TaxID=2682844 RepID=A0A6N8IM89_9BURK|nr:MULTISPECIES: alpha/beta fold hydrolase [Ramlibacter]MBA2960603.1 alpha/beta fold hydrolase [Ramlibacter sp. CGMCC 1.13660]MVQ27934.1 alpha/beta fold hydrolase [Ramlibacter pinisoli]